MKKLILSLLLGVVSLAGMAQAPKSPRLTAESTNVKVSYGQPSKRGRVIFGELVKYGEVWRTGANQATEITFAKDGTFGGKTVKAGNYSLFTIPSEKEWKVILNSELKQWGSYSYDKIKDKNVAEVSVAVNPLDKEVEALTIITDDKTLNISWEKTSVSIPLGF